MTKLFAGSVWAQVNINEKAEWGRVWINPSMDINDFKAFFEEKGYYLNYLNKSKWNPIASTD